MNLNGSNDITVCVPVFNGERYLREALDSILAQSLQPEQIIIADNNSTDETKKICEFYVENNPNIKYIRHDKNIGLISNFHFLLNQVKTDFFVYLCADDFWDKSFLKELRKDFLTDSNIVSSYPRVVNIDKNGKEYSRRNDCVDTKRYDVNEVKSGIALEISGDWLYSLFKTSAYLESFSKALAYTSKKPWGGYTQILFEGHILPVLIAEHGEFHQNNNYLLFKRNHQDASDTRDNKIKITFFHIHQYFFGYLHFLPKNATVIQRLRYVLKSFDQTLNVALAYYKGSLILRYLFIVTKKLSGFLVHYFFPSPLKYLR
jgi:glycosyltransferase involved in cell wall biosynthesis